MGYTTEFKGKFQITPVLQPEHHEYLQKFSETRRMQRDPKVALTLPDPVREAVGLPIGEEGEYFVGGIGYCGQDEDASIVNHNRPPSGQPGLWCQWETDVINSTLQWNQGEKFYNYTDWLQYLVTNFFIEWGYTLHGSVVWQGEDSTDNGKIVVVNNDILITSVDCAVKSLTVNS
jgi:hypothetical protein